MAALKHWSPSQANAFNTCERRWAGEKLFKLPVPEEAESKAQALGSLVHNQIESHGQEGVEPTEPLASLAIEWLLTNTGPLRVFEQHTKEPQLLAYGLPLNGFIDVQDLTNPEQIEIIDWKTKSSFDYLLTDEQIAHDPQMITYARWVSLKYQPKRVRVRHVYLRTGLKKPNPDNALRLATATLNAAEILQNYRPVEETIGQMVHIAATAKSFNDVPANASACHKWGRPCPYIMQCDAATMVSPGYGAPSITLPPEQGSTVSTQSETQRIQAKVRATGINPPDAAQPVEAAATSSTPAPVPATVSTTATGLHLYINVLPAKGVSGATNLDDLIAPVAKAIADRAGVSDIRQIKYAEGTTLLCAHFRTNPPTGIVLASSAGLSGLVAESLLSVAVTSWRGVS